MQTPRSLRLPHLLTSVTIIAGTLALCTTGALANKVNIGYHTKQQIHTICKNAGGVDSSGTDGTWGCNAKDWWIGCKNHGKICIISTWRTAPTDDDFAGGTHKSASTMGGSGGTGGGGGTGGSGGGSGGHAGVTALGGSASGNPGAKTGGISTLAD